MSADNTPGNSLSSMESLDWSDIPVLDSDPGPQVDARQKEMSKPELTPAYRQRLVNDIHMAVERVRPLGGVKWHGDYEIAMSPVDSNLVKPSKQGNGMLIKLWQHRAVSKGGVIDSEKPKFIVTYHETMPNESGGFDYYKEPAAFIPIRGEDLDVAIFWDQVINSRGDRDEPLIDSKAFELDQEIREAEWFPLAA